MNVLQYLKVAVLLVAISATSVSAQTTNISGVINTYAAVTAINALNNTLTIGSPTGFSVGDKVLVIQMKGATIDQTNTSSFGTILGIGTAGIHEIATIASLSLTGITLQYSLCNTYNTALAVQVVKVPSYVNVNITGTLTAQPWNGSSGGILIFEATGTVTFNADINVNGQGFLGGTICNGFFGCSSSSTYYGTTATCQGGGKGEGIAVMPAGTFATNLAKLANGGGGSNYGNNGGGGGGNAGAGGRSGDEYSGCSTTNVWAPGGNAVPIASNRIIAGGGGGGGYADNGSISSAGGNAGGIVVIIANSIQGNGFAINANGADVTTIATDEGSGGGGAGGSVYLHTTNVTGNLFVNVNGGFGGSNNNVIFASNCHGTGGGGGGGALWIQSATVPANITLSAAGGAAGTVNNPASSCYQTTYNATAGANGAAFPNLQPIIGGNATNVKLGNDTTFCSGSSLTLSPGLFTNYLWQNGSTNPTLTATTTGLYWVEVTGCGGTVGRDSIYITVLPSPSPNLGADTTICKGESATLTAGSFPNILWSTGATSSSITVNVQGTYSILVTDVNGCTGTDSKQVNVGAIEPNVIASAADSLCLPTALTLSVLSGGNPNNYVWNFGDGTIVTTAVPFASHTYAMAGSYVYTVTASNALGCSGSVVDSIYAGSKSGAFLRLLDSSVCVGDNIKCIDSFSPPSLAWSYNFGDGHILNNAHNPTHAYTNSGTYNVTLTSLNYACPPSSIVVPVVVQAVPAVNLGPDTAYCDGFSSPILLTDLNASSSGFSNLWSDGSTLPALAVNKPGYYYLTKYTSNGCMGSDTVLVRNDCYINIPNAFTPGTDGLNNYFMPLAELSSGITSYELNIFNRWGEMVFATKNINSIGWDGNFGNKPQPMGTYIYMINVVFKNGVKKVYNGNVTLIR